MSTLENSSDNADSSTAKSARQFVNQLEERHPVNDIYLVKDKALLTGKTGKSYVCMFLSDRTGAIDARIWENAESISGLFQNGDLVRVKGQVQIFQNRKQVVIHKLEKVEAHDLDLNEFVAKAARDPEEMFQQLLKYVHLIQNASLKQLTLDVLQDPEIRSKVLLTPAAKSIHHAYLGGLLEHIVSICGLMQNIHTHYQSQNVQLNLDYLLFGAIFHDIGKIWELQVQQGTTYTDKGRLLGHMIMAVELVEKKASRILGFPEELKDMCKHIILSHHGKLEYGSPKTPAFIEAFIVAAIDDFDSKINTIHEFMKAEREGSADEEKWSRLNHLFERYFMIRY